MLDDGVPEVDQDLVESLGMAVAEVVKRRLVDSREREGRLRMSSIGRPCNRQLYYSVNNPEDAEDLPPQARMKFLFGDILEEVLLFLAEVAGHSVEGRQDTLEICGVTGHRDAVIDGVTVDAKSASTYAFKKFEEGRLSEDDPFGYEDQLQSYIEAGKDDPVVTDKDRGAFLVVDKTLGHICLDVHRRRTGIPIEAIYEYKKEMVDRPDPPGRGFDPIPEGKSGNMKLGLNCSYCEFKQKCYPDLRTFLYSNKPVHLTKVVREPNVPELTRS